MSRHIVGRMKNGACEVCGWKEAPCDRHRKDSQTGYTLDNVVILCPNHHRLAHHDKS